MKGNNPADTVRWRTATREQRFASATMQAERQAVRKALFALKHRERSVRGGHATFAKYTKEEWSARSYKAGMASARSWWARKAEAEARGEVLIHWSTKR